MFLWHTFQRLSVKELRDLLNRALLSYQEGVRGPTDGILVIDLSKGENSVNTISIGTEVGLILAHAHFVGTRYSVEDNACQQFGCDTYQTNSSDFPTMTCHLPRKSA